MNHRKQITVCCSFAAMLILILDGKAALSEAAEGMDLCIKTVIPSLFPFLFLSSVITQSYWGESVPLLELPARLLGIPRGAESILITTVMGGYPAGARAVGDAYAHRTLTREESERLLTFCSIAGPAFIFGMLSSQFPEIHQLWALWSIQLISSAFVAHLNRKYSVGYAKLDANQISLSQILNQTTKIIANICGWILLFRILTGFLSRWILWKLPDWSQVLLCGLLELSNGCCTLSQIPNLPIRFMICSIILSFGGVCIVMQTASVIGTLSLKPYLFGKLKQTGFSLILSLFYLQHGWTGLIISIVLIWILLGFFKKGMDFRNKRMYNNIIIIERVHADAVS